MSGASIEPKQKRLRYAEAKAPKRERKNPVRFESATGLQNQAEEEQISTEGGWVLIHPTPKTMLFKEILMGELGYTEGQGVYNAIRSTEAAIRQIQTTILTNTLNATRYEDLAKDWQTHLDSRGVSAEEIAATYGMFSEGEAVRVAEQIFATWHRTLQMSLLDFVRSITACFSASEPDGTASFAKYIDWIACLGLIPLQRLKRAPGATVHPKLWRKLPTDVPSLESCVDERDLAGKLYVANSLLREGLEAVVELARCTASVAIMDYDRVKIFYHYKRREVVAIDSTTGRRGECLVLWQPIWKDGTVLFDSPLQRICGEVCNCHALREHAKLCQLLNTVPVKILVGRKKEESQGPGWASKAVDKLMGEGEEMHSSSAASRLVKLIVNMKSMRHIGDITETVRSYLDETSTNILSSAQIDTSMPGFGQSGKTRQGGNMPVQEAFRTSVINGINGMLEGYVNNLFKTIEDLRAGNGGLLNQLQDRESELTHLREQLLRVTQAAADGNTPPPSVGSCTAHGGAKAGELGHEVIDIRNLMGDDGYVANSFQSRYIPAYAADVERLSRLWDQELLRCFKMNRITNNQGQEMSVSYSNSSISLLLAPYFFSILRARHLGFLITHQEAYRSEEELCVAVFKKTRLEAYLTELSTLFVAKVRNSIAALNSANWKTSVPGDDTPSEEEQPDNERYYAGRDRSLSPQRYRGRNGGGYYKRRRFSNSYSRRSGLARNSSIRDRSQRGSRAAPFLHDHVNH
ncbi:capsid portal protein [Equid alphaherpesvirus 4]|uniref:Capsid portal protein n=1 Tax=Equid alphaherpesvirus 4 TaxID=10331 RepID=A0A0Y0A4E8_9ALPH|nr:capsid portal protein [Equid alphaherpesvirus 4]AMB16015.1 capsid portal protein [Equid alphaherpesvirus 4]AMB16094.1 capsid portal protein [Equid alphaherpesvirus 4]AMB16173.1 capsid portal protein [Equid alphaherpesvirus 4]AMB16252.1 capsid portal protein [Equid alphaherpesvirus 4]